MASDTGIIYVIAVGCGVFGLVTAYLIYRNVQHEKAEYFKDKLRRKQLKKDPINYDYTAPKEQKRALSGPVVEPGVDKPDPRGVIPVPAPILAPIAVPPFPIPDPVPTHDTAPLLDNPAAVPNTYSNNDALFTAAPAGAVGGAAAGAGAFAAYQAVKPQPEPVRHPEDDQPKKNKKSKKRKGSIKKVSEEDFDDYRNFTPTVLPPPKGAPPRANYTPSGSPEVQPPQYVQAIDVEGGRPDRDLALPPVAIVNRDGLLF